MLLTNTGPTLLLIQVLTARNNYTFLLSPVTPWSEQVKVQMCFLIPGILLLQESQDHQAWMDTLPCNLLSAFQTVEVALDTATSASLSTGENPLSPLNMT